VRNTSSWKTDAWKILDAAWGENGSDGDSRRLVDVELVLFLAAQVAPGHPFTDAWALLGGYPFLRASQPTVPQDHRRMIAVARHLVLRFKNSRDWQEALEDYSKYPEQVRGYVLDPVTGHQQPRETSVWPERWERYRHILSVPPPYSLGSLTVAHDGRHFNQLQPWTSVTIPRWLPGAMKLIADTRVAGHDVTARQDREPLTVTWADLMAAARWGDEAEDRAGLPAGERSNWADRLARVTLEVRQADNTFAESEVLTIAGIMHLIGMVGAGKSTLVDVLVLWCARRGNKVCVIADNVTAVLRKVAHLQALGIKAAPVLGQSNRAQHLVRLHRLTSTRDGRIAPVDERMFNYASTACALDGLRDHAAEPWEIRHAPCLNLVPVADSDVEATEHDGARRTRACPLWDRCQRHQPSRDLVTADIWVATTASLVHTGVPRHLNDQRLRYLELAWNRSDLIIVDEADQVQAQLDSIFSPEQQLIGRDYDAWLDEVIARTKHAIRQAGREQMHEPLVRQWLMALDNANNAVDILYSALSRDAARPQPALSRRWLDKAYFTEWTLSQSLAQTWAGYGPTRSDAHQPEQGWESDPIFLRLRRAFDGLIDDPLGTSEAADPITGDLVTLTAQILRDATEPVRLARVMAWFEVLSKQLEADNLTVSIADVEREAVRLEFTLMVAVLANQLDLLMSLFRAIEFELGLEGTSSALFHKAPRDYQPVVPESPMGNVLGFQYLDDNQNRGARRGPMGRLRFFRCSGVGRSVLLGLHELFHADSPHGPNVLLLSATSWAGTSARYHIDVPVSAILTPPAKELEAVRASSFQFLPLYIGDRSTPVRVSGKFGDAREAALRQMTAALADPGPGKSILEQHRDRLPEGRRRLLLLTGSYAEARMVAQHLAALRSSWRDQILHLVADDEEFTDSWDGAASLRRSDVHTLATTPAWILVAPLLAVERGHNILNDVKEAAIGAAYFLIRPHPRPDDLSYVIQRANRWAIEQIRDGFPAVDGADRLRLGSCARAFRAAGHRKWRGLLSLKLAYSSLPPREREALAWTQLVTMWQVIGRLVRGGVPAQVYFCDAAFAPAAAQRAAGQRDDASLSLLIGLRDVLTPYFASGCTDPDTYLVHALYGCLHEALSQLKGL
jgi:hypothetical protein